MSPDDPTFTGDARLSWLLHQVGSLARQGAAEESIQAFLEAESQVRCDPPLEPAEIQRAVASAITFETYERGFRGSAFQKFRREEERRQRFTLISDEDIADLPAPEWTIDGVVQEQSVSLWYGSRGDKRYVDRLDQSSGQAALRAVGDGGESGPPDPRGDQLVTNLDSQEERSLQVVEKTGAGERTRTVDLLITNL